jgi:hypothetical protein
VATKNDVTGDSLVSKPLSKDGEENWDRIFGKRIKEQKLNHEDMVNIMLKNPTVLAEYELDKSTGELCRTNNKNNNGRSSES